MQIDTVSFEHPFGAKPSPRSFAPGVTINDIVISHGIPAERLLGYHVVISKGRSQSIIPLSDWGRVRPKEGTFITILPAVQGPLVGAILIAIITAAAPTLAGLILGAGASLFATSLVSAAISIIGALIVNALIPPPSADGAQGLGSDPTNFTITGSSNVERPYGVFPIPIGRHLMFPPKTARGYTQMDDQDVLFRGRYTWGYGPVALETLKIGTTDITAFEGVEIEFRNVDETLTKANIPGIDALVTNWRTGAEPMTLYPDNINEDGYTALLVSGNIVYRETRSDVTSASVDVRFPRGLILFFQGDKHSAAVTFNYSYRLAGDITWVSAGSRTFTNTVTSGLQYTNEITFPTAGRYEVAVERVTDDDQPRNDAFNPDNNAKYITEAFLSTVRSIKEGTLPSDPDIAEVVIKIKASDQLNGVVKTLNGIVQQLVPIWNGASWSAPVVNRHPAWAYARVLQGPLNQTPLADDKIMLDAIKAWADEEPHWTCDGIIDQPMTIRDLLDTIAATGRAVRGLRDLKHTIIRDGANGPIEGHLTPHNSYNFAGNIVFPKAIHGFKVRVVSEKREWKKDEYIVYADGYTAVNATEFETLDLPFVVLSKTDIDQSNGWRLGRYHLAQAILRPETFTVNTSLEHIPWSRGDKVRVVHDVPVIGVGSSRIKTVVNIPAVSTTVTLDEIIDTSVSGTSLRFYVRQSSSGDEVQFDGVLTDGQVVIASGDVAVLPGDMVQVVEMTSEGLVGLITNIEHEGDLQAQITFVEAAPAVLDADQGAIPAYVPTISNISDANKPAVPIVNRVFSGTDAVLSEDGVPDRARIGIELMPDFANGAAPSNYQMRWKAAFTDGWATGPLLNINVFIYSDVIAQSQSYSVDVRTVAINGETSVWLDVGSVFATITTDVPGDVRNFEVQVSSGQSIFTWSKGGSDISHYHMRYSSDSAATWNNCIDVNSSIPLNTLTVPSLNGLYLIKAVSFGGISSTNAVAIVVTSADISSFDVVETATFETLFTGLIGSGLDRVGSELQFGLEAGEATGTAEYTPDTIIDLGATYPVRLVSNATLEGVNLSIDMFDIGDIFGLTDIFGEEPSDWSVVVQVRSTDDDPADEVLRNLVLWSEELDNASWMNTGTIETVDALLSPDGYTTAEKLVELAVDTEHFIRSNLISSAPAGTYIQSIFVHETSERDITLRPVHIGDTNNTSEATFDVGNRTFSVLSGNADAAGYDALGSGWLRVWLSFTTTGIRNIQAGWQCNNSGSSVYLGDGASGLFLWGAQLEEAVAVSDYQKITTTPSPVIVTGATWSPWENLTIGEYVARAFQFKVIFTINSENIRVDMQEWGIVASVPGRIETGRDLTVPISGVTVVFDDEFRSLPSVLIDGQALPTGATTTRTVRVDGFDLEFFNSGGTSIAASCDWHAIGFGKKIG